MPPLATAMLYHLPLASSTLASVLPHLPTLATAMLYHPRDTVQCVHNVLPVRANEHLAKVATLARLASLATLASVVATLSMPGLVTAEQNQAEHFNPATTMKVFFSSIK